MVPDKQLVSLSKFLSLVLRHRPELIGIVLDQQGWTAIDDLLAKAADYGVVMDKETLLKIVETNAKKRFALNDTFDKIRASQGHSVEVELGYTSQRPPTILYHGTAEKSVEAISLEGLVRQSRQHVHLSTDAVTARVVGQRRGKPFIFSVQAGRMFDDNFTFYLADNGVWLTEHVPAIYLSPHTGS